MSVFLYLGFCLSAPLAVIDRKLLVEEMEIRQAAGRRSPLVKLTEIQGLQKCLERAGDLASFSLGKTLIEMYRDFCSNSDSYLKYETCSSIDVQEMRRRCVDMFKCPGH